MNNIIIDYQQFYNDLLSLHNDHRAKHGAGPLILDDNVSNNSFYSFIVKIRKFRQAKG